MEVMRNRAKAEKIDHNLDHTNLNSSVCSAVFFLLKMSEVKPELDLMSRSSKLLNILDRRGLELQGGMIFTGFRRIFIHFTRQKLLHFETELIVALPTRVV
ncbi:hypothetical protein PoB_003515300 [Plakobranchus ocellatus]|uniref:Cyclin N-terminal domain-containing protein n=1 Tax=Plakobranchus ocellatus TaxID=259542 RepID=A0AAV4AMX5_9GAST|nr:hypothetical protein PoB_003515300 [Plakobranchus ocellatus]